jgi:hypothetical protein
MAASAFGFETAAMTLGVRRKNAQSHFRAMKICLTRVSLRLCLWVAREPAKLLLAIVNFLTGDLGIALGKPVHLSGEIILFTAMSLT